MRLTSFEYQKQIPHKSGTLRLSVEFRRVFWLKSVLKRRNFVCLQVALGLNYHSFGLNGSYLFFAEEFSFSER